MTNKYLEKIALNYSAVLGAAVKKGTTSRDLTNAVDNKVRQNIDKSKNLLSQAELAGGRKARAAKDSVGTGAQQIKDSIKATLTGKSYTKESRKKAIRAALPHAREERKLLRKSKALKNSADKLRTKKDSLEDAHIALERKALR